MVDNYLLTFIIPVYNAEQYLSRCINSIYCQQLDPSLFEIIAINDGSSDNSLSVLETFEKQYHNFRIINKDNEGVSKARNDGVQAAAGEYLVFLDADDVICDGSLKKVSLYLQNSSHPDFVETIQVRYYDSSNHIKKVSHLVEGSVYSGYTAFKSGHVRTNAGGAIVRRQFLSDNNLLFPVGLKNGEDSVFFAYAQIFARSIEFYNIEFYGIYLVPHSASRCSFTKRACDLCETVNYAQSLRHRLTIPEKKAGLLEYVIYQMLSNTVYCFVKSKNLHLKDLKDRIDLNIVLPINVSYIYIAKKKARLMNYSFDLFYFLSWLLSLFTKKNKGVLL